jgi:VWFA-related protein
VRTAIVVATLAGIGVAVAAQQPPADTFRTSVRLVPISVVVHDRAGKPVEDLTAADFRITEDGNEHPVALFSVESRAAARAAAPPLPPNVFSNRVEGPAAAAVTVILFDSLNTGDMDQMRAREHVVRFLRQLQPEDRVGLYVLGGASVHVLHDFTSDAASLLRALERMTSLTTGALEASDASLGKVDPTGIPAIDEVMERFLARAESGIRGFFQERRAMSTTSALEAIAHRLAGVRGRKNVIWISSGFPLVFQDWEFLRSMSPEVRRATRALSHSDVAIYPVDARGLTVFASHPSAKEQVIPTLGQSRAPLDASLTIADQTGGRAFHSTNDLGTAMARALADSDVTYVLGYYPRNETWDGRFRTIRVSVNRRGVDVRHRRGYYAHPPATAAADDGGAAILEALRSPLDATGLTISASVSPGPKPSQVQFDILLHEGSVSLQRSASGWEGSVQLAIAQDLPDGRLLRSLDRAVQLRLSNEQRDVVLQQGVSLTVTIDLHAESHHVRIAARDLQSGDVGSLTIPAGRLRR